MYVPPNKSLPGLKARSNALKAAHAATASSEQKINNASALSTVVAASKR